MFLFEPLPKATRRGILLIGFLFGVMLYLIYLDEKNATAFLSASTLLYLYTLMSTFVITASMIVMRFSDRRFWWLVFLPLPFVALMSGWVDWNSQGIEDTSDYVGFVLYATSLPVMIFLALPWLQGRLRAVNGWGSWSEFYDQIWRNGTIVLLNGAVALFFWAILGLWAGLFRLLGIRFFSELFFNTPSFILIAGPTVAAAGVVMSRGQQYHGAIKRFCTLFSTGILPVLSFVGLMFLATLPFVGLGSIPHYFSSNVVLNILAYMVMSAAAMVYHPEREVRPYSVWLEVVVRLALLLSPIYTLLAGYALWIRVSDYGWTPQRVYAGLITLVMFVWACGYVVTIVRKRSDAILNPGYLSRAILLLILVLLVGVNSPVLDPFRISVNSQMSRYREGKLQADNLSLSMLTLAGRRGYDAMRELQKDPAFNASESRRQRLASRLNEDVPESESNPKPEPTVELLRRRIGLTSSQQTPEDAWWQDVFESRGRQARDCMDDAQSSCFVVGVDLNNDGANEWLLCGLNENYCSVYGKTDNRWKYIGRAQNLDKNQMMQMLKQAGSQGTLKTEQKAWRDIVVEGKRIEISYN